MEWGRDRGREEGEQLFAQLSRLDLIESDRWASGNIRWPGSLSHFSPLIPARVKTGKRDCDF